MENQFEDFEITTLCCSAGDNEAWLVQWFSPERENEVLMLDDITGVDEDIIRHARRHPETNIFLHVARIRSSDDGRLEIKILEKNQDDTNSVSTFWQDVTPPQILPEVYAGFLESPEHLRHSREGIVPCGSSAAESGCLVYSVSSLFTGWSGWDQVFPGRHALGDFLQKLQSVKFDDYYMHIRRVDTSACPIGYFYGEDRALGDCFLHTPTKTHAVAIKIVVRDSVIVPVMYCALQPDVELPLTLENYVTSGGCRRGSRTGVTWKLTLIKRQK